MGWRQICWAFWEPRSPQSVSRAGTAAQVLCSPLLAASRSAQLCGESASLLSAGSSLSSALRGYSQLSARIHAARSFDSLLLLQKDPDTPGCSVLDQCPDLEMRQNSDFLLFPPHDEHTARNIFFFSSSPSWPCVFCASSLRFHRIRFGFDETLNPTQPHHRDDH